MTHPARALARLPALLPILLLALLGLCACASMPRMLGGGTGDVTLVLDGDQAHQAEIDRGRALSLVLRDPAPKGYALAGTSFDPALLRLEGIEPLENGRLRYRFQTLATGQTDVVVKIRRGDQGPQEIFKRVAVTIQAP